MIATQAAPSLKHATRRIIAHSHSLNWAIEAAPATTPDNLDRIRRNVAQELRLTRGTCYWGNPSLLAVILQTATVAILYVSPQS